MSRDSSPDDPPAAARANRDQPADATAGEPTAARVTQWLDAARAGKAAAVAQLVDAMYPELHRVAAAYMRRERPGQTLQATALVNEAYLRLVRDRSLSWQNRAHFCAIAANAMRQILVERARAKHAAKRGGGGDRLTLQEGLAAAPDDPVDAIDVIALDEALERLARVDPERARLVEVRYFGGLTIEETAEALGMSPATVKRSWALARAWLKKELAG